MLCIIFSEEYCQPEKLFPFTLTRRTQDIRLGILTIREKWEISMSLPSFDKWEGDYKETTKAIRIDTGIQPGNYLLIHANILPTPALVKEVKSLEPGSVLMHPDAGAIAFHFAHTDVTAPHKIKVSKTIPYTGDIPVLQMPWDIFRMNELAIQLDVELLTSGRVSAPVSSTNQVLGSENIFLEPGAVMEFCTVNATTGPVYIGKEALVMEGSILRGPIAIAEQAVIKMGSKIYGATTIGPKSVVGGEIKNSVLMGYSNKAHDGYLGDAVIGEWCNLGAGSSASNVKNNAGPVYVYHPYSEGGMGLAGQKCGLLMADYSRAAINSSFNTGSVVGVSSSVFGIGLLPRYIPNFSWGAEGVKKYEFSKAIRDIRNWKKLKDHELSEREENILKYIYDNY